MKISSAAIAALFLLSACGDQQDGSSPSAATTASSTPTSTRRRFRSPPFARGTPLSDYNFGGGGGVWRARTGVGARGRRIVYMGTDGAWGTSVLLTVSADGSGAPVPISRTWVAEWYGDHPISWQGGGTASHAR